PVLAEVAEVLRRLLTAGHPVIGVARSIVEEAVGTRLSVLLVMLVVVALPTLPLVLDPGERLAYRVQFFLDGSLSGASVLLALITIALSCTSVCGDIESRRTTWRSRSRSAAGSISSASGSASCCSTSCS
ncbi:MAG: hypothetical protein ACKOK8_11720, partial [Planctomycetia bacterium]